MASQFAIVGNTKFELFYPPEAHLPLAAEIALIYIMHGRLSSRSSVKDICQEMALRYNDNDKKLVHVVVCSFDNPNHGEQVIDKIKNTSFVDGNTTHALDMYSQLTAAVDQMKLGLDFLPILLKTKITRAVVCGISQGGHAALLAMTHEPRFSCCVSWIGTANFNELMLQRVSDKEAQYPPLLENLVSSRDPCNNLEKLADRYLCVINGGNDTLVPAGLNLTFVDQLRLKYTMKYKLEFAVHPGIGHLVNKEMKEQGLMFIELFLKRNSSFSFRDESHI